MLIAHNQPPQTPVFGALPDISHLQTFLWILCIHFGDATARN